MKSIAKSLLGIAASLMLFTSCSSPVKNTQTKTSSETSTTQTSTDGPVEIQYWYGLGSVAGETMESIIKDFNESQDEVKVTGVQQSSYDETYQKVQAAIAANQPPAVFISGNYSSIASKGIFADIEPYLDETFDKDDYLDVFMDPAYVDGKLYGLPAYGTTQVIYYRKDKLEEAGIDPKEAFSSWEKVYETSKKLVDDGVTTYGHLPMWGPDNLTDIALSNGGKILSDDGTEVLIDSPEWVEAWNFIREQVYDNKLAKIESGGEGWEYWYRTIDSVMNGQAMSYTGSSGDKGNLDFSIIDSIPQPGLNGNPAKPQAGALYLVIPEKAGEDEKKAAAKWIQYFTSPEVSAKWSKAIGYIPVRKSANEVKEYKTFIEENPYAGVPFEQAQTASPSFVDPTGGQITDELTKAADKLELQNVDASEALSEAKENAQAALDKYLSEKK
ncbi:ABC transporter substrate-binding protein [Anaerococcus sp. Marseille-Q5996]|uniref:ABC transporter substrate-binding protein n=1 Tax=Anaerococcus sp. Marseille-Q5996 TaxID=2972769 RepID=UPI0021CAA659|nr:ABC transporter substrate-binding protein [Anaerococcus sp. Marseille-Q5996]